MLKAILFDFDGTLAATMEDNFRAWRAACASQGLEIEPHDYYPFEGTRVRELPALLFARYGKTPPDAEALVRSKEEYYRKHHKFSFYPGVESLIERLRANGVRLGIVTAGMTSRLEATVPGGFLARFEAIVTGPDTEHGKPHPDPYLKGLEKLGLTARDCLAVENAPLGIEAARGAGLYCIAVAATVERELLKEAEEIVDSFEMLASCKKIGELLT